MPCVVLPGPRTFCWTFVVIVNWFEADAVWFVWSVELTILPVEDSTIIIGLKQTGCDTAKNILKNQNV